MCRNVLHWQNIYRLLTIAIAPITLIPFGFNLATHCKNPATTAEPHLSLDIPAITPTTINGLFMSYRS